MQNRENNLTLNDVTQRVKEGIYNKYGFYLNEGNLYNICKTELEKQYKGNLYSHINTSQTWINNANFFDSLHVENLIDVINEYYDKKGITPERKPLTHLEILEGVNNLFDNSYQQYLRSSKHFDAQYNRDQLEQIHDYFYSQLGGSNTEKLLADKRRKTQGGK
mgnify:CR=1 FL=1